MTLKPGMMKTMEVAREADFGYFLTYGEEDVLLHKKQITAPINVGDQIKVFLYHDHQERLSATMEEPILTIEDTFAWLKVVDVNEKDGVFLYNGIVRDVFLSVDELGTDRALWPKIDEKLPVALTYDKKGRLMARLSRGGFLEQGATKAEKTIVNQNVTGTVYHFAEKGVFIFTEEGYVAFLHSKEIQGPLHLGQVITARVIFVRDDGKINISMQPKAHERRGDDAEKIYEFLLQRDGGMPYTDKSDRSIIEQKFQMSKGAFKRALGKLMKENKIYQKDGWTFKKEN